MGLKRNLEKAYSMNLKHKGSIKDAANAIYHDIWKTKAFSVASLALYAISRYSDECNTEFMLITSDEACGSGKTTFRHNKSIANHKIAQAVLEDYENSL